MNYEQLKTNASKMVAKGKGILAADESTPTCGKRFDSIGVESTELNRNTYRDLLFTTERMEEFISGVILYDETLRQSTLDDNTPFADYLKSKGVIPGIKVDMGAKPLALHSGEKVTEGLDGLRDRLQEYYKLGARFAKWRAVITIGEDIPTDACISVNAHALARYAALCQEAGIVPIVEPEVLMDGDHSIDTCHSVSEKTFRQVFADLDTQNIYLEGMVLKPNMVVSGMDCSHQAGVEEVADRTVECLKATVPSEVPGCAFLSGGQSNEDATAHLNMMNAKHSSSLDWNLTFSYGRALQASALTAWGGRDENIPAAQDAFYQRAKFNSLATTGTYSEELEVEMV
ncbi:MAG: fructose-bisphosphate aldolase class I [Candidatus Marinimicrobia bacterium]|jgi:fructose-bisphosphate aldolase class I|nr:fructose-bisphosphate aldolase class I [Candidatus Neomarinimicrobiota bacterium]MDP6936200.1 fructose-bisphosphate aldolase class I [Candidatus Neomarinimicrobiota bacterium]